MVAFIAVAALIVGSTNMGFQPRQANPDVKSFVQSNSHVIQDSYVD